MKPLWSPLNSDEFAGPLRPIGECMKVEAYQPACTYYSTCSLSISIDQLVPQQLCSDPYWNQHDVRTDREFYAGRTPMSHEEFATIVEEDAMEHRMLVIDGRLRTYARDPCIMMQDQSDPRAVPYEIGQEMVACCAFLFGQNRPQVSL